LIFSSSSSFEFFASFALKIFCLALLRFEVRGGRPIPDSREDLESERGIAEHGKAGVPHARTRPLTGRSWWPGVVIWNIDRGGGVCK